MPNLRRMINLEKLALYFVTDRRGTFIQGSNLKTSITNSMPRLNQFIFNIRSIVSFSDLLYFPSNEDIHRTFTTSKNGEIISCVDYFSKERYGQCHIYSCPYTLTHYDNITNHFPGGLFQNVQVAQLFDEHPFEHQFFIRISQSFPFLKCITIHNFEGQQSKDQNHQTSIIEYSHLNTIHLLWVHDDYLEEFLLDTNIYLPNDIALTINYDQLKRVTQDFTRSETRKNCSKIKKLFLPDSFQLPNDYHHYFPHLE